MSKTSSNNASSSTKSDIL